MAKSKLTHKVIINNQFNCEGILDVDNLAYGTIYCELEDEGSIDLKDYIDRFNSHHVKITITNKVEELPGE